MRLGRLGRVLVRPGAFRSVSRASSSPDVGGRIIRGRRISGPLMSTKYEVTRGIRGTSVRSTRQKSKNAVARKARWRIITFEHL